MKWLGVKKVDEIYQLIKPTYQALKKTHCFLDRKASEISSSTICEDLVGYLITKDIVTINVEKLGSLSLNDVILTNEDM